MDRVTNQKAKYLEEHGYTVTGYILTNLENGKRATVDHGRVQWLSKEQAMIVLGHAPDDTDTKNEYPHMDAFTDKYKHEKSVEKTGTLVAGTEDSKGN